MISRTLAAGLLAVGCLTAAAGGSYLAVRQNAVEVQPPSTPAPAETPVAPAVNESEGVVAPPSAPGGPNPAGTTPVEAAPPVTGPPPTPERRVLPRTPQSRRAAPARVSRESQPTAVPAGASTAPASSIPAPAVSNEPTPVERAVVTEAPPVVEAPPEPTFQEIVIPASSVIGLELETTVTSERAQVEDRVNARVTRDVYADGRLAIPAGSRVVGAVTLVERGGKVKERARLGVRFHTLVLANGRQVGLRTETVYRDGDSPAGESSRKIGGAAIGGAVLGAILGGGKGAIAGATAGAAGGTAAVMAGGRNPATLPGGSVITVKLSAPASFEIER